MNLATAIAARRTFAIISHPDAGKTTLTEKLLLYGGAVALAGSVTSRKNQRATTSDWMELERQRGISISSTLLQFDYGGYHVNLLDTPGHQDFSEDTYRVLTAVDAAVMVIDAGKGIEAQTRKLFDVCRRRGVPIFTFMNKCDRPIREPLELLDELESVLGISAFPVNWPIGAGPTFRGVYDRMERKVHLFERTQGGAFAAPVDVLGLDDPSLAARLDETVHATALDEIQMLDGAGATFDHAAVLAGRTTPVFFGSAANNFGVQLLLDNFLRWSSPPTPRTSTNGAIEPSDERFSGFVFKIQANMDPKHRDRIAFVRIVSGAFERDMNVVHVQSGRRVRLGHAQKLFGQERETVDEAVAGDVVGLVGNDLFQIGDTLTSDRTIRYNEIPRFAPECFSFLHNPQPSNFKRFRQGLDQLLREGVVQVLDLGAARQRVPLLAAIGPLQFEVVQARLEAEYNAPSRLERAPYAIARWYRRLPDSDPTREIDAPDRVALATDAYGDAMALFPDEWAIRDFTRRNPHVELATVPFPSAADADAQ
jgi:peptide chain release factor 3